MEFISYLKAKGYEVTELKHAYRINGVVDVWKNGYTVYNIPHNEYKHFYDIKELDPYVLAVLENHPKKDPFKKTAKNRISYQEFKNNLYNAKKKSKG